MDLAQALVHVQSPQASQRDAAYQYLQVLKHADPSQFLEELAAILKSAAPSEAKQLASILLKNLLDNAAHEPVLDQLWQRHSTKASVREACLGALADPAIFRAAAQAVAAIARQDLPQGEWPELVQILSLNAVNVEPRIKLASLLTLGYICEDVPQTDQASRIVTVIVAGIQDPAEEVKLVSLQALRSCVRFLEAIMRNDQDRAMILSVVLQHCQHTTEEVTTKAFGILCDVVVTYYEYLQYHITDIAEVTLWACSRASNAVAVLAVEVWNIIAFAELEQPNRSYGVIAQAGNHLVPLLLNGISVVSGDVDEWTLDKACVSTLMTVTQLTKGTLLQKPVQFIGEHLTGTASQQRAACLVLGSIVEGPSEALVQALVARNLFTVLACAQSTDIEVVVAAVWALSRVCSLHATAFGSNTPQVLNCLGAALAGSPRVVPHACWALSQLFVSLPNYLDASSFMHFFGILYNLTRAHNHNVVLSVYSCMSTLIVQAPASCQTCIQSLLPELLRQLTVTAHYYPLVHACFLKIGPISLPHDQLQLFVAAIDQALVSRSLNEEELLALGAFVTTVRDQATPYLKQISAVLVQALQEHAAVPACSAAAVVVGDLAHALGSTLVGHIEGVVDELINVLVAPSADGEAKVRSLESLADLAEKASVCLKRKLPQILELIEGAAALTLRNAEDDLGKYLEQLRLAVLVFYGSFVRGFELQLVGQQAPRIIQFIKDAQAYLKTTAQLSEAFGVIGDLMLLFGSRLREELYGLQEFLEIHKASDSLSEQVARTQRLFNSL